MRLDGTRTELKSDYQSGALPTALKANPALLFQIT